jgi:phosphatidylinositol-4,5-bisphosphate 3-kinase
MQSKSQSVKSENFSNWKPAFDEFNRLYWINTANNSTSFESPTTVPIQPSKPPASLYPAPNTIPFLAIDGSVAMLPKAAAIQQKGTRPKDADHLRSTSNVETRAPSPSVSPAATLPNFVKEPLIIDQTAVEGLIGFDELPWEFEGNDAAYVYRLRAAKLNRRKLIPNAQYFTFPRFLTDAPVLNTKIQPVRVLLPKGANKSLNHTKIQISNEDTAFSAIQSALKKCTEASYPPEKCLFKVTGREEYIYGDNKLINFEYINYQIRHNEEIRLQLLYFPDIKSVIAKTKAELDEEFATPAYPEEFASTKVPELDVDDDLKENWSSWNKWPYIPASKLDLPFKTHICGIEDPEMFPRLASGLITHIYVKFQLYLGTSPIRNSAFETNRIALTGGDVKFFHSNPASSSLVIQKLPYASKLVFLVYGVNTEKKDVLLGFVLQQLYDHRDSLISGNRKLRLWTVPNEKSILDELFFLKRGTCAQNLSSRKVPTLQVKFDEFSIPVVCRPFAKVNKELLALAKLPEITIDFRMRSNLSKIITKDILQPLTDEEKQNLWAARRSLLDNSEVLPKLLSCVDWTDLAMSNEARLLMQDWSKFSKPVDALQLLEAQYADPLIRRYAVDILKGMSDAELSEYLLELVQCLKFESSHWSYLGNFLIERALQNPYQVGHFLFWNLKAELHNPDFCERYALILEEYLLQNSKHAKELQVQNIYVRKFLEVADLIAKYRHIDKRDKAFCMNALKEELNGLNRTFPDNYQIPLNPRWQARSLIVDECKYMSSKKVPLWLVFENSDECGDKMLVIFKSGDDLRQDMLTLQFIRTMDKIWLSEGLDLRMKPYTCVATGVNPDNEGAGMVEIVTKSTTISRIQIEEGGGATGALKLDPLDNYIKKHNQNEVYEQAVDNFIRSCAGYCVATFVMGIGDRHNDNIMMTQSGHLFHIDFGHFLGNFKKKLGFKRERALLVFTPEMAYVMGGLKSEKYRQFSSLSSESFLVLRKYSSLWLNLFQLMQAAGMPELTTEDDIDYIRERLCLTDDDEGAKKTIQKELVHSHDDLYRRLDNTIHNVKHG